MAWQAPKQPQKKPTPKYVQSNSEKSIRFNSKLKIRVLRKKHIL